MSRMANIYVNAERVRTARIVRGVKWTELADAVGLTYDALQNCMTDNKLNPHRLHSLAKALEVNPKWLTDQSDSPVMSGALHCKHCRYCKPVRELVGERHICVKHHIYRVDPESDWCGWAIGKDLVKDDDPADDIVQRRG